MPRQMLCYGAHRIAEWLKIRVIGIFRYEAHMGYHVRHAQQMGEIGTVTQILMRISRNSSGTRPSVFWPS